MPLADAASEGASLDAFLPLAGSERWRARMAELAARMRSGTLAARAAQRRHALELTLARLSARRPATPAEQRLAALAGEAVALDAALEEEPRRRLRAMIQGGLEGAGTLVPLLHLLRTAATFRARGFEVRHDGLLFGASYDLLVRREHAVAEVACETLSAEAGRPVHKGVFAALVDRVNPELQTWLAAHPGRYVLKMTLPEGLAEPGGIAALHERIAAMLATEKRHHSEADVLLKLDPLVLAGAQAAGALPERLRQQFGAEAHLAVTGDAQSGSVLVMAARAGQGNEVAAAAARHLRDAAWTRLTGRQPGILSLFLDDLDGAEWRDLCVSLELEGECRRFLTTEEAKRVVAVTCATRHEMLGLPGAAPEGELRFRNPSHPSAKSPGLEPAILSSV
ncbi:hypothetical protein [Sabulicella glaciei]|uniref:Uncharacterized protein n=1 Tax=Sabulicella glaciei TaxID=2984948 RepID=A0ABT3NTY2_9PROT|nr:hypothetical protein [Roseococcus sp. MDT2-1-1]MCW8085343.1 hypothetical protein [Roseococcus sp. MDT2-1-1]